MAARLVDSMTGATRAEYVHRWFSGSYVGKGGMSASLVACFTE